MKLSTGLFFLLLASPCFAAKARIQLACGGPAPSVIVDPDARLRLGSLPPKNPWVGGFPFTVPAAKFLGICTASFASKNNGRQDAWVGPSPGGSYQLLTQSSYLVMFTLKPDDSPDQVLFTVAEHQSERRFEPCYVIGPGPLRLDGHFVNVSSWVQNMQAVLNGWLADTEAEVP